MYRTTQKCRCIQQCYVLGWITETSRLGRWMQETDHPWCGHTTRPPCTRRSSTFSSTRSRWCSGPPKGEDDQTPLPLCLHPCFAFLWRTTIALAAISSLQKQQPAQKTCLSSFFTFASEPMLGIFVQMSKEKTCQEESEWYWTCVCTRGVGRRGWALLNTMQGIFVLQMSWS